MVEVNFWAETSIAIFKIDKKYSNFPGRFERQPKLIYWV